MSTLRLQPPQVAVDSAFIQSLAESAGQAGTRRPAVRRAIRVGTLVAATLLGLSGAAYAATQIVPEIIPRWTPSPEAPAEPQPAVTNDSQPASGGLRPAEVDSDNPDDDGGRGDDGPSAVEPERDWTADESESDDDESEEETDRSDGESESGNSDDSAEPDEDSPDGTSDDGDDDESSSDSDE